MIKDLQAHQVFVFGSNRQGRHGAGAAKQALKWGAIYGRSKGRQGQTYAIVTKDLLKGERSIDLIEIKAQIVEFLKHANHHRENEFLVTAIGCGLGGYSPDEIADLWNDAGGIPENVVLPQEFRECRR